MRVQTELKTESIYVDEIIDIAFFASIKSALCAKRVLSHIALIQRHGIEEKKNTHTQNVDRLVVYRLEWIFHWEPEAVQ